MSENLQFVEISTDTRTPYGNFYNGELRKVTDQVAGYLIGNGWAEMAIVELDEEKQAPPDPVTLEVDGVNLGVKSEEIG